MAAPAELLLGWLRRQAPEAAMAWLDQALAGLRGGAGDGKLFLAIGLVPRRLGKDDLSLTEADLRDADAARSGWRPAGWSVDQAGRLVLLLNAAPGERFAGLLDQLCRTGDVGELVTFYRGLPLYPRPETLVARAREGVRTNMKAVFEAVAHDNPYPAEQFDEEAWNQMVVKALFIGAGLDRIQGLDRRRNADLARMLCDYAHERWAAHRTVAPELWRCVGPFADRDSLVDLGKVLANGNREERRGAALALAECPRPEARQLLETAPELASAIRQGRLRWNDTVIRAAQ
ncbi:MAG: EboA domain-containing protein [Alphaproteobacteria bacterium]|nr:EboA domain-containing protein [Alphaproteobacteria bacterium]